MKKLLAVLCIVVLCAGLLIYSFVEAPDRPDPTPDTTGGSTDGGDGKLYFLNGQPVLQLIYDQLTEEFAAQTGIEITTVSSADNLGEKPVLFSVSGPDELGQWPCLDLKDTVAYANLTCSCFTLTEGEKICGIAGEAEPFGIIYNTALLARAGYTGTDINSFAELQTVAQLITGQAETLGFGAFSAPDEAGRFADLMAAVPGDSRPFWDLCCVNGAEGSLSEGKAVFQPGTLTDMERLSASGELQLQMLPLYTGAPEEENRGLYCFGTHYWCVREDAAEEEINAALAFLNFLVSPRVDGTVPVDDLALLSPYRQAAYANNPVEQRLRSDIALGKELTVCGSEVPAPAGYAEALLAYADDPTDENWQAALQLLEP